MKNKKFITISNSIILGDEWNEGYESTIEILRTGNFKHMWYGDLKITPKLLEKMIKNFNDNVLQREVSYDFQHDPTLGAVSWLKKLFTEEKEDGKTVLKATVEWTKKGFEAVKSKSFRYFSTEYRDEYQDKENGKNYGATILGGGLTNRPFIPGLNPIALSENQAEPFMEVQEMNLEELLARIAEIEKTLSDLNEKKKEDGVKDQITKLESEKVELTKKLEEMKKEGEDEAAALKAKNEELETKLSEALDKIKTLSEGGGNTKVLEELSSKVKILQEAQETLKGMNTKLSEQLAKEKKDKFNNQVETQCEKWLSDGVTPAIINIAKPLMLSSFGSNVVVKLSEGEGESKKEIDKDIYDSVVSLVSAIPKVDMEERSLSESIRPGEGTEDDSKMLKEVEEYAEKHKISFEEAIVEFSKQGKINV